MISALVGPFASNHTSFEASNRFSPTATPQVGNFACVRYFWEPLTVVGCISTRRVGLSSAEPDSTKLKSPYTPMPSSYSPNTLPMAATQSHQSLSRSGLALTSRRKRFFGKSIEPTK